MIIAVSANSDNVNEQMEPRFGRAAGFMLFNSETNSFSYVENSANSQLAQGAGIQTAQMLADHNVEVAISGRFGPKALAAMERGGIEMVELDGVTVRQAAESYLSRQPKGSGKTGGDLSARDEVNYPGPGTARCRAAGGSGRGLGRSRGGRGMGSGRGLGGRGAGAGRNW